MFDDAAINDMVRQNEERVRAASEIQDRIKEQTGHATSESGMASAVVGADGRLHELELNPRLMRGTSHQVAAEVVEAVNLALEDLQARIAEVMRPLGPVEDVLSPDNPAITEIRQFGERMKESFQEVLTELERRNRR